MYVWGKPGLDVPYAYLGHDEKGNPIWVFVDGLSPEGAGVHSDRIPLARPSTMPPGSVTPAKLVDPMAKKPGHVLCTIYFRVKDVSYCLQMIEGRRRNEVVFRGIRRAAGKAAHMFLYTLSGPGFDVLRQMVEGIRLAGGPAFPACTLSDIRVTPGDRIAESKRAEVKRVSDITMDIYPLPIRSVDGISPDSLLVTASAEDLDISEIVITGFVHGFAAWGVVAVVGICVAGAAAFHAMDTHTTFTATFSHTDGGTTGSITVQGAPGSGDAGPGGGEPGPLQ
jgi:hypothetical protein